jgi:hypothetical protein
VKHDIETEVAALRKATTGQVCERFAQLFGEKPRTRHKAYLIRRIAWRLQAIAEGDLSERARRRAEELANDAEVRVTPPRGTDAQPRPGGASATRAIVSTDRRLPAPGPAIVRQYKGQTLRVLVVPDGLEFDGNRYKSLSAVAKAVTGSHCNGYARQKAIQWWQRRSPDPVPDTAERAVEIAEGGGVAHTEKITVRSITGEKYDTIVGHKLGPMPEPVPAGECGGYDEAEIPF